ncbi:MAG: type II toxin-antitoxin system RelE/ParE family toxin [Magnetococcales bacterium]|nr:type II toxin-antitoxin system RelE/ParE family toxin [Magnetococcales bacterium]
MIKSIKTNEHIGVPGRVHGTREIFSGKYKYVVIYRIKSDEIQILRILHTSRKYP